MPSTLISDLFDAPIIHRVTRAGLIADGALIDVTDLAGDVGIRWPVAVSAAAYSLICDIPASATGQCIAGRTWDVLWKAGLPERQAAPGQGRLTFKVLLTTDCPDPLTTLVIVAGPGDDGAPVLTILLPEED